MKKLQHNKITASRMLAEVPSHRCSNFIISVSQAAAHWLQYKVKTKYWIFGFIKPIGLILIGYRYVTVEISTARYSRKFALSFCALALQPTAGGIKSLGIASHEHISQNGTLHGVQSFNNRLNPNVV